MTIIDNAMASPAHRVMHESVKTITRKSTATQKMTHLVRVRVRVGGRGRGRGRVRVGVRVRG